jgi:hypothetical protein
VRLAIRVTDEGVPFAARSGSRPTKTYLEGELALEGLSLVLGANSTGKTTLLEAVEQALVSGWKPREHRGLYRPQRSTKRLVAHFDTTDGTEDSFLLAAAESIRDERSLGETVAQRNRPMSTVIAEISDEQAREEAEDEETYDAIPPIELLHHVAREGRVLVEPDGDDTWLTLDLPEAGDAVWPFAVMGPSLRDLILPGVVAAAAEQADTSALAEALVGDLIAHWFDVSSSPGVEDPTDLPPWHPWLEPDEFDKAHLALGARSAAKLLTNEVRRLLPNFVKHEGPFTIRMLEPPHWAGGRHVVAGFEQNRRFQRAELTGSGTRRWLALCMGLANELLKARQITEIEEIRAWHSGLSEHDLEPPTGRRPVLLIDEPELHLHPLAQRDAAAWMERRLLLGDVSAVIAATHSPTLLGATGSAARIVALRREVGRTEIHTLEGELLEQLDTLAVEAGLGREAWFFATKAVLLVEGQHDLEVLNHFYNRRLSGLRVRVLALRGAKNSSRLVDSEFLGASGLPLHVLFDNVRAEAIRGNLGEEPRTEEEKIMRSVMLKAEHDDISFLPFSEPDILCALPRATVERRYGKAAAGLLTGSDAYWTDEIDLWRQESEAQQRLSFKRWIAEHRLGLAAGTDLVPALLSTLEPTDLPSPELRSALEHLEVAVRSRDLDSL